MCVGEGLDAEVLVVSSGRKGPIGEESLAGAECVLPLLESEFDSPRCAEVLEQADGSPLGRAVHLAGALREYGADDLGGMDAGGAS